MAKVNKTTAKLAKAAADKIIEFIDHDADSLGNNELLRLVETFAILAEIVVKNGGPAWNATDECWEK